MSKQGTGQEWINRYVHAVTQKLPAQQRADIENELRSLIEDMLDGRVKGDPITDADVEAVLLELGSPGKLAARYTSHPRYLISPDLFDGYLAVLKIVLISTVIGLSVVFVIQLLLNPALAGAAVGRYIASLITAAAHGFAWVTLLFALAEYMGVKRQQLGVAQKDQWKPADLPPIPDPRSRIKRTESISGIIFAILGVVVFTYAIELLGVYASNESGAATVVPFFHADAVRGYLPYVWAILVLGIVRDCLKVIDRKWTSKTVAMHIAYTSAAFVLACVMFSDAIWNPTFMNDLVRSGIVAPGSEAFQIVAAVWSRIPAGLIAVIGIFSVIDIVQVSVKAYRSMNRAM